MANKKPKLDVTTTNIVQRLLALPPKPHEKMKLHGPAKKKKRKAKDRASSSKP